jgi:hypothetical protein
MKQVPVSRKGTFALVCPQSDVMFKRLLVGSLCLACTVIVLAQEAPKARSGGAKKAPKPEPQGICLVADFRNLALTLHDPKLRQDAAIDWLKNHTQTCNLDQLQMINRYRAVWLGTSDNPKVAGIIDSLIELKSAGDAQKLQEIFGPQASMATPTDAVVATAKPHLPTTAYQLISPPMQPLGPNSGVIIGYPNLPNPAVPPAMPAPAIPAPGTPRP